MDEQHFTIDGHLDYSEYVPKELLILTIQQPLAGNDDLLFISNLLFDSLCPLSAVGRKIIGHI